VAVAYKSAGAGASSETSGAAVSPASPAVVDAGDILIIHAYFEGTTTAPDTPSGFTLLAGPYTISTVARVWIYGKIADGTEDGAANALGTQAVTTMRAGRCYSFSGRVSGTITDLVKGFNWSQGALSTVGSPTVSTSIAGSLACFFFGTNDNNSMGASTGESGGDWTEAVAEYTVALTPGLTLQLQTALPTSDPGTLSGGSSTQGAADPWGSIGLEIRPSVPVSPNCIVPVTAVPAAGVSGTTTAGAAVGALPTFISYKSLVLLIGNIAVGGTMAITANGIVDDWTLLSGFPVTVAAGDKLYIWAGTFDETTSLRTPPSVSADSDHYSAGLMAFYMPDLAATVTDDIQAIATGSETPGDTSFSFATGVSTDRANSKIVCCLAHTIDIGSAVSSTQANANLTNVAERLDFSTANGEGGGQVTLDGDLATAGAVGTWSSSLSAITVKAYASIALSMNDSPAGGGGGEQFMSIIVGL
jgi:hypothetical protein